jgi:predicted aspartyl protease
VSSTMIIEKPGLLFSHSKPVRTANGNVERRIFAGAIVFIQGREIQTEVMENDITTPALIGYLVLEHVDLIPDIKTQKLIGNPEHGGKWIIDMY